MVIFYKYFKKRQISSLKIKPVIYKKKFASSSSTYLYSHHTFISIDDEKMLKLFLFFVYIHLTFYKIYILKIIKSSLSLISTNTKLNYNLRTF